MSICKDWVKLETEVVQTLIKARLKKQAAGIDTTMLDLVIANKIADIKRASEG